MKFVILLMTLRGRHLPLTQKHPLPAQTVCIINVLLHDFFLGTGQVVEMANRVFGPWEEVYSTIIGSMGTSEVL